MLFIITGICFAVRVYADEAIVTIEVPYTADTFEIQLDGVTVPIDPVAGEPGHYKVAVNDSSDFITAIQYSAQIYDGTDRLTTQAALDAYPEHMAVWEVNRIVSSESSTSEQTSATGESHSISFDVRRVDGLDDVLGYEGFAIKPPSSDGTQSGGIRCSLSILTDVRDNGVTIDENRAYTVEEYGHLHIFSRNWNEQSKDHMTINDQLVIPIYCYKKGVANYVLRTDGDRKVFANSLYDIVDYNVKKNFRGYIKLHKTSTDSDVYLYGPIVGRNPYYVAKHLKDNGYPNCGPLLTSFINTIVDTVEGTGSGSSSGGSSNTRREYNVFFIGDSIMMGMTLKPGRTVGTNYTDYEQVSKPPSVLIGNALAGRLRETASKVNCTLIANGGATYSEPGANRYNMPQLARLAISEGQARNITPDFIFLMAGVNDWAYRDQGQGDDGDSAVFGVSYNGTGLITNQFARPDLIYAETGRPYTQYDRSYCIGVDKTLKLLTDPDAFPADDTITPKIIVCSPLRALWTSGPGTVTVNESTNRTLSDYSYVQRSVSNYYRNTRNKEVYFINLYDEILGPMGLPTEEHSVPERHSNFRNFFPDGYHPNQAGYNKACQIVLNDMHDPLNLIPAAPVD